MSEPGNAGIAFFGGYQVYSDSGVDLTLLRENLKRSPSERLVRNERMVRFCAELRDAGSGQSRENTSGTRAPGIMETEAIFKQLFGERVAFVLIDGLAMRAHGSAHVTDDIDICYSRSADNIVALAKALAPLHPYMRGAPAGLPFTFDAQTIAAGLNFTLSTDAGAVDVLGEVTGVGSYTECFRQSDEKMVFGYPVRVLSLDGLIAAKRAAGRTKDRLHLLELDELKKMRDSAS